VGGWLAGHSSAEFCGRETEKRIQQTEAKALRKLLNRTRQKQLDEILMSNSPKK
jgi:hypothetical protein